MLTMWFTRYKTLKHMLERIIMDIATLKDLLAKQSAVIGDSVSLLNTLHQQLKDVSAKLAAAGADTTGLDEIAAAISANTQKMVDADAANTDAASTASGP